MKRKEERQDQKSPVGKENPSPKSTGISRRDFARRVGWAAAAALPGSLLLPSAPEAAALLSPLQEPETSGLPPESRTRVEEKLQSILRLYPDRLRADQVQELRRILNVIERMLVKVRAVPLQNGNPPADVLKLYRGGDEPLSSSASSGHPSGKQRSASHSARRSR